MWDTSQFIERVDAACNAIFDKMVGWLDSAWAAGLSRGGELMGSLGSSMSEGVRSLKTSIGNAVAPNSLGKSNNPSPDMGISQTKAPSMAPARSPEKDIGSILQDAGFSMDSFGGSAIEATDLGASASVGYDGVGCASHQAPRAVQTQMMTR